MGFPLQKAHHPSLTLNTNSEIAPASIGQSRIISCNRIGAFAGGKTSHQESGSNFKWLRRDQLRFMNFSTRCNPQALSWKPQELFRFYWSGLCWLADWLIKLSAVRDLIMRRGQLHDCFCSISTRRFVFTETVHVNTSPQIGMAMFAWEICGFWVYMVRICCFIVIA